MARTTLGILIGLVLGVVCVLGSFGDMLLVALFAVIGFVVAKVLDGDLDLGPQVNALRSKL